MPLSRLDSITEKLRHAFIRCAAAARQHRSSMAISALVLGGVAVFTLATYIQPRQHSTTQLARLLNDDVWVANQFKTQGLRADETVTMQSAQDTSYTASASDAWGAYALKGSVSVMPSSGGAQIIWTLEHDAGWHPVQRWLATSRMAAQRGALQLRLQAFKQSLNVVSPTPTSTPSPTLSPTLSPAAKP